MRPRPRFAWLHALLVVVTICVVAQQTLAAERLNVVLIVADDLGLQLGCYGDAKAQTPRIDDFAKQALRFDRAYCTTASCSASRSVIMTGLYNHGTGHFGHAHGYNHFSTYDTVRSLPSILSDAGYRTCLAGKYHLAPETVYPFEHRIGGGRNGVEMAKRFQSWARETNDKPFFLYFCPTDPHRGGGADGFGNEQNKPNAFPGVTHIPFAPDDVAPPNWLPNRPEAKREWAAFHSAVARLDQGVGALFDVLRELGRWDDTLILFGSDNGPPFPGAKTTMYEPGIRLPLIVRHPREPAGHGRSTSAMVSWVDLAPTIVEAAGVDAGRSPRAVPVEVGSTIKPNQPRGPHEFHGRSFLSVLRDPAVAGFDELFASHTFHEVTMYYPMRTIRLGRYKLIWNIAHGLPYPFASDLQESKTWQATLAAGDLKQTPYGLRSAHQYVHRPAFELFDLDADPDEVRNLAADPVHADRLAELKAKLKEHQKRTKDPWLLKWDYE